MAAAQPAAAVIETPHFGETAEGGAVEHGGARGGDQMNIAEPAVGGDAHADFLFALPAFAPRQRGVHETSGQRIALTESEHRRAGVDVWRIALGGGLCGWRGLARLIDDAGCGGPRRSSSDSSGRAVVARRVGS